MGRGVRGLGSWSCRFRALRGSAWVSVLPAVLLVGCSGGCWCLWLCWWLSGVLVFPLLMRLVRNGFLSWAAMVVLCVVPSWMLARVTGSAGASLFWCCVVGVVGALWFVLDMWAIEKCADTHRDAAFEWLAAWALVCDLIVLIASLLGASNNDDDASR